MANENYITSVCGCVWREIFVPTRVLIIQKLQKQAFLCLRNIFELRV